ncbi:MAG: EamA family transporter [Syntrophomonadaceae bacterium]|nr:EamA family transporter [Syntrophomonadaceae bacterium]
MRSGRIILVLILAVACVSTGSILTRLSTAPPLAIGFYRLSLIAFFGGLLWWSTGQSWRGLREHLGAVTLSGLFLALHFGLWITSLFYTSVASSVLFTNLQVIFVIFLSALFLKERIKPGVAAGVAIALMGSFVIGGGDLLHGRILGDLLALAGGAFFAGYLLVGRKVRSEVDIWPYTVIVSGVAAAFLGLALMLKGYSWPGYSNLDYLLFVMMAIIPGLGGHAVFNWALKYVKAPVVSVSILGESVGAALLAFIVFRENLAWFQLLGGLLVLMGLSLALTRENPHEEPPGLSG